MTDVLYADAPSDRYGFDGFLIAIGYSASGTPYDATVDFSFTVPGLDLWVENNITSSRVKYPRFQAHSTDGSLITRNANATPFRQPYLLIDEPITVSITNGGNTKSGNIHILIGKHLDGAQEMGL